MLRRESSAFAKVRAALQPQVDSVIRDTLQVEQQLGATLAGMSGQGGLQHQPTLPLEMRACKGRQCPNFAQELPADTQQLGLHRDARDALLANQEVLGHRQSAPMQVVIRDRAGGARERLQCRHSPGLTPSAGVDKEPDGLLLLKILPSDEHNGIALTPRRTSSCRRCRRRTFPTSVVFRNCKFLAQGGPPLGRSRARLRCLRRTKPVQLPTRSHGG